mmetsp:Transcript_20105/g.31902  ORF Transcript_20105/g.31902 Transcript_20105/m.31902 type:complete len:171 (+) Transcript_20105:1571-2083(+)
MKRIGDKFEFRDEGELTRLAQKYDITPLKQRPNLSLKLTSMPPGKPVVWKSNKQKVVAMSSGEAVYCDSQAAISIAAKPGEDNPADILTKALPGPSNKKHCDFLFPISYREKLTIMLQGTRKRKITTKTLPHKLPRLVVAPRPFRNLSLRQVSYYGLYAQLCAQLRWGRM